MSVTGLAITHSGSGYTNGTLPLTFSGGGGTGAANCDHLERHGDIGRHHQPRQRLYFSPSLDRLDGGGTVAAGATTLSVNAVSVTNAGTGYTSAPTVTISPPLGDDIYTGTYDINGTTAITSSSPNYLQSLVIVSSTAEVTPPGQRQFGYSGPDHVSGPHDVGGPDPRQRQCAGAQRHGDGGDDQRRHYDGDDRGRCHHD